MKEKQIEVKNFKTVYEAEDGTQFNDKSDCERYEKTFSCAMRSHIKGIALRMTAEDCVWMNGSCDNKVYSVVPRNEDDILRIRQMMAGMGAHKSTLDLLSAEHIGKVLLIVTGYDEDWVAFQTLEGLVKDATDGKYELKKKEEAAA